MVNSDSLELVALLQILKVEELCMGQQNLPDLMCRSATKTFSPTYYLRYSANFGLMLLTLSPSSALCMQSK